MGAAHLEALRQMPDERVAGVFTRDRGKIGGGLRSLSIEEALADASIDAVDICLPTHLHAPVTLDALRAGKHVLVEKPMALDAASAREMAAEAERRGRILMVAQVLRFWPAYAALRETVRGGRFGGVRHARFERRSGVPTWGAWLCDPALTGGGAFDLLIHDVDMCLHLFGRPSAVSAVRYQELLDAQLYYADLTAHISGGWQPDGDLPFRMEYTVTLESAAIDYSSHGRPATLYSAEGAAAIETSTADPYGAEIAYFAACCRAGRAPELCPPAESADAVALTLLLLRAGLRNGEKIACEI